MNKFVSPVSCLAALGSLLSGLLVFLHYYPDLGETYLCNGTFLGNCNPVHQSSYSALFGFPIAAYGLFFYLVIWWTMLVADYAQGSYGLVGFTLLFPLIVLALLVDLVLILLLIQLRQFCSLCFLTYAINVSLLVVFLFWLKWLVKRDEISSSSVKALLWSQWRSPERKAASSLYRERLANCTVDGVAGFRRLVAGGPSAGREFSDSIDRKIGQAREHRAEVVADR